MCSRLWLYLLQFYKWGSLLPLSVLTLSFFSRKLLSLHGRMFWVEDCQGLLRAAVPSSTHHSPDTPLLASIHRACPLLVSTPSIPRSLMMGSLPPASSLAHPDSPCASVLSHCCTHAHSTYFLCIPSWTPAPAAAPSSLLCDTCWHLVTAVTSKFCHVLAVSTLHSEFLEVLNITLLFL